MHSLPHSSVDRPSWSEGQIPERLSIECTFPKEHPVLSEHELKYIFNHLQLHELAPVRQTSRDMQKLVARIWKQRSPTHEKLRFSSLMKCSIQKKWEEKDFLGDHCLYAGIKRFLKSSVTAFFLEQPIYCSKEAPKEAAEEIEKYLAHASSLPPLYRSYLTHACSVYRTSSMQEASSKKIISMQQLQVAEERSMQEGVLFSGDALLLAMCHAQTMLSQNGGLDKSEKARLYLLLEKALPGGANVVATFAHYLSPYIDMDKTVAYTLEALLQKDSHALWLNESDEMFVFRRELMRQMKEEAFCSKIRLSPYSSWICCEVIHYLLKMHDKNRSDDVLQSIVELCSAMAQINPDDFVALKEKLVASKDQELLLLLAIELQRTWLQQIKDVMPERPMSVQSLMDRGCSEKEAYKRVLEFSTYSAFFPSRLVSSQKEQALVLLDSMLCSQLSVADIKEVYFGSAVEDRWAKEKALANRFTAEDLMSMDVFESFVQRSRAIMSNATQGDAR